MVNTTQPKVLVGMPCLGEIKAKTVQSLLSYKNRVEKEKKHETKIAFIQDTYIHSARNRLVYMAVEEKATHLMFIDSDTTFEPHAIDQLLEHRQNIVGGVYFGRYEPRPVLAQIKEINGENVLSTPEKLPKEIFSVSGIGTGFLLMNMDVFKIMKPPFFTHSTPEEWDLKPMPFPKNTVGEDYTFCLQAQLDGFTVWADPNLNIGHVGERIYKLRDHKQWQKNKEFYP